MKAIKKAWSALWRRPKGNVQVALKENKEVIEKLAKPKKAAPIKIAIDESVGLAMAKRIKAKGYEIVCKAGNAEPDDVWMKRAFANGALFIVSPDLDIPSMIERENLPMVWIDFLFASQVDPLINTRTREVKRDLWAQYVHDRIQAKMKFYRKEFGGCIP